MAITSPLITRKFFSAFLAVILLGTLAGLVGALAFKKIPAGWLPNQKDADSKPAEPAPLFYKVVGDSSAPDTRGADGAANAESGVPDVKFTIEIAKLNSRELAEKTIKDLAQHGLEAYYTPLLKDGRVIYRVRYGIFETEALARTAKKSIDSKHALKTTISQM